MAYGFINIKNEDEICLENAPRLWYFAIVLMHVSLFYSIHRCPEWSPVWWTGLRFYTRARWPHDGRMCPRPTAVTPAPLSTHHATPPETCTPLSSHAGTLNMSMRNIFQDSPILTVKPRLGGQNDCTLLRVSFQETMSVCAKLDRYISSSPYLT